MENCIFCGIASGKVPSKKIFEDDSVLVVLDIYPANPAHMLIIPKKHYDDFTKLPEKDAEKIGDISQKLEEMLDTLVKPDSVAVFIANGDSAGQKAPHFIAHVIPRFSNDGVLLDIPENGEKTGNELLSKVRKTVQNYFPEQKFES